MSGASHSPASAEGEALRQSEERFRSVSELVSDFAYAFRIEPDGQVAVEWLTEAFSRFSGYTRADAGARGGWQSLIHPDDLPIALQHGRTLLSGRPDVAEFRLVAKGGEARWLRNYARPEWDQDLGRVVRIVGAAQDITARRQTEEALRRDHDLLSRVMETSPAGIVVVDRDGQITLANNRAEQVLGLTVAEITRRTYNAPQWHITDYDGNPFPEEDLPFRRVMATGRPVYDVRHAIEWPDGRRVLLVINAAPLRDESGQVEGMVTLVEDVSAQIQAEQRLKEGEATLRSLFRAAPIGIGLTTNRVLGWTNDALQKMVGYSGEELLGQSARMLYDSDEEYERVGREKYAEIAKRGTGSIETRFRRRDGSTLDVQLSSTPLNPPDISAGVIFTAMDISERKRAYEALLASEERFARAFRSSPDSITITALRDDRYVEVNDAFLHMTGYSRTEVLGHTSQELNFWVNPEDRARLVRLVQEQGAVHDLELRMRAKAGTIGIVLVSAERIDLGDEPCLLAISKDITQRKQAEAERAQLYASEQIRRQIAETLRQATAVLNSTLRLEQVLELILQQLRVVIPYDSASIQQLHEDYLEIIACHGFPDAGKVVGLHFPMDPKFPNSLVIQTKAPLASEDISKDYGHFQGEAEIYESGHIQSWLGVPLLVKDQVIGMITLDRGNIYPFTAEESELAMAFANQAAVAMENARLYDDLQRQMERLKSTQAQFIQSAKLAAVGELAAGVAHELNNPLTSVLGFAEVLLEELPPDDSHRHDLETITAEARRARDIIRNLLDFARQVKPDRHSTHLNDLLHRTLLLIRQHIETGGVKIVEEYDPYLRPLSMDEGQMKQVFLNLISNAAQAMPAGGMLTIHTASEGSEVVVRISDTGVGMSAEVQSHLFEPFFTTKPAGTGLGLSVSLGIVQEHGGSITVESQEGQGSCFQVRLPADEPAGR